MTEAGDDIADEPPNSGVGSPRRSPARTILLGIGGRGGLMLVNMLVLVVTSRCLTPAEFGMFAIAQLCVDFANSASYTLVCVPMLQRHRMRGTDYAGAFTLLLILGSVAAMLVWVASDAVEAWLEMPGLGLLLKAISVVVALRFVAAFYTATLQRHLRVEQIVAAQTRSQIFASICVTLVLALAGFGAWSLLIGLFVSTLLEVSWYVRVARFRVRLGLGAQSWKLVADGVAPFANRMLVFGSDSVDRLAIGYSFGATALGLYSRATSLVQIPETLIGAPAQNALLAWFSRIKSQKSRVASALAGTLCNQGVLLGPLVIALSLSAPLLVRLLLGARWAEVVPVAQVLFIGTIARLGTVSMETSALTLGYAWGAARRQAAAAVVLVIGLAIALSHSLIWVACAVVASRLVGYVLGIRYAVITFRISWTPILASHLMGLAVAALGLGTTRLGIYCLPPMPELARQFVEPAIFVATSGALFVAGPSWLVGSAGRTAFAALAAKVGGSAAKRT